MKVLKAKVLTYNDYFDEVFLETDLPDTSGNLVMNFHVNADKGAEYVRKFFDIEPEIL